MKEVLAEKLLAKVLQWEPTDVARERPLLQAMASLKYDAYEQYSPGLRFLESFALWLNQFEPADRVIAYNFIRTSLVFCSAEEMDHLVETSYQDHLRPILLGRSAYEQGLSGKHVGRIVASDSFRLIQRRTLFLGLSDGARIDTFRRANPELNHEQIWQTHELSDERVGELLEKLSRHTDGAATTFSSIVLLDDFSASGSSYYSFKADSTPTGKIAKFLRTLADNTSALHKMCDPGGVEVLILIYLATEQAICHLRSSLAAKPIPGVSKIRIDTVQLIPEKIRFLRNGPDEFTKIIEKYYNTQVHDKVFDVHMQKGGAIDAKYGYADCGLPVILHHNAPNNSVAILWFYEQCKLRGLFPRIQRHREMS